MSDPHGAGGSGAGYEELRARLESLGYLSRPLDRFVLSGIAGPGSFVRRHAAVSLKVALAAGPLLGLLFALAVVVVNRPRFSRPLDFILLGVYFSLTFGAAVLFLEFVAGLALAAIVRWRGRGVAAFQVTAARAGFAVSLVVSAYLAFWWRRRAGGGGGIVLDGLGLMVLMLVNAALLRVSSLASLAALVRVSDLPPGAAQERRPGARLLALVAAILLAAGFLLAPAGPRTSKPPSFEQLPVAGRVFVVAWDGIPAELFEQLFPPAHVDSADSALHPPPAAPAPVRPSAASAQTARAAAATGSPAPSVNAASAPGEIPPPPIPGGRSFLARLRGAPGVPAPSRPSYWTMIATGRLPSEHGVGEIEEKQALGISSPLGGNVPLSTVLGIFVPGRKVAVSAEVRRARTVWEILADREGVGVVGWWATWPAVGAGTLERPFAVVSDRALFSLQVLPAEELRVAPESLARELGIHLGEDLDAVRARAVRSLGDLRRSPGLEQAALIDGYAARAAVKLAAEPGIKALFIYLPGLDIVRSLQSGGADLVPGSSPSATLVEDYARYVQDLITPLLASVGSEDWVVVIADPGRAGGQPSLRAGDSGWIRVSGPGVTPPTLSLQGGPTVETWFPLDVAPTLLNLRGFPKSREMRGQTRVAFLETTWRERLKPREISTYGENLVTAVPAPEPESEMEILDRLRSLGYVK